MHNKQAAKAQAAADQQATSAEMAATQAKLAELQAQQAAAAAAPSAASTPAAAAGGDDLMTELQSLADMQAAGVLDDAEFSAAKARLLAG